MIEQCHISKHYLTKSINLHLQQNLNFIATDKMTGLESNQFSQLDPLQVLLS